MGKMKQTYLITGIILMHLLNTAFAQNPVIRDQFSADPTARVFNGKVYLFPSHDIPAPDHKPMLKKWFCMADYHVFSSENLMDWKDHGVIVSQDNVEWVDSTAYAMWAPDCIERNGKYYFYFPAVMKPQKNQDENAIRMSSIGVAIAEKPEGPYVAEPSYIRGVLGIDPGLFIDNDGQAYIYWTGSYLNVKPQQETSGGFRDSISEHGLIVSKLKDNMLELEGKPRLIKELPIKGLAEGPFLFERNGIYYFSYPHMENNVERLEYAMGDNPMGPFIWKGVIMDESPVECWTVHHSILEYKGQWYLFYHQNDYSPDFDKNRSVHIDSLFFNPDGTIKKVPRTRRGVGLTPATSEIQIDRYSNVSSLGTSISFLNSDNTFEGWKTTFVGSNAWVQYNAVNIVDEIKTIELRLNSPRGGKLDIYTGEGGGFNPNARTLIAEVNVPEAKDWSLVKAPVSNLETGIKNLVIMNEGTGIVEVDWIRFEN